MKIAKAIATGILILSSIAVTAAPDSTVVHKWPVPKPGQARPKIGLALSGGGAKGAAYVGILKVIDELGIPIDYISGCSMGSIVGGLYAIGYTTDEISEIIARQDWAQLLSNNVKKDFKSLMKEDFDSKFGVKIPFGSDVIEKGKEYRNRDASTNIISTLPAGAIDGNNIVNLLNSLVVGYQDTIDFKKLPIPFSCVAVDLVGRQEVILDKGHLPSAIRASMAIPGIFAPVRIGDMMLVDGGFLDNFPVEVCRNMGADIVIGLEISKDFYRTAEDIKSLPQIFGEIFRMIVTATSEDNRNLVDILIRPDVAQFGILDFNTESINTIIEKGLEAGRAKMGELRELKAYLESFGPLPKRNVHRRALDLYDVELPLSGVFFGDIKPRDEDFFLRKTGLKKMLKEGNCTIDGQQLETYIAIIKGCGAYDDVTYNLVEDGRGAYELHFHLVPKPPHNANFGLYADTYEAVSVALGAGFNQNRLNGFAATLEGKLSMSPRVKLSASYAACPWPKVNAAFEFSSNNISFYNRDEQKKTHSYTAHRFNVLKGEIFLSEFYSKSMKTAFGANIRRVQTNTSFVGDGSIPAWQETSASVFWRYTFDTRDNRLLTMRGNCFDLDLDYVFNLNNPYETFNYKSGTIQRGNCLQFGAVRLSAVLPIPMGEHFSLVPQIYGRAVLPTVGLLAADGKSQGSYADMVISNVGIFNTTTVGSLIPGRVFDYTLPFAGFYHFKNITDETAFDLVFKLDARVCFLERHYVTAMGNVLASSYAWGRHMLDGEFPYREDVPELSGKPYLSHNYGAALEYAYNSILGPVRLNVGWSNYGAMKFNVFLSFGYYF